MNDFFDRQNELFERAVNGDSMAREQMIIDNIHVANQVAYTLMAGKTMTDEEREDELQTAHLILVETIDAMINKGVMYNIKYLRSNLNNRLMSYYRKEKYGIDNNSMNKDESKKARLLQIKNTYSIDSDDFDSCISDGRDLEGSILTSVYIDDLLSILSDDERLLIDLLIYQQLTQQEIANVLGIKQCTVSVKYKSIINKLRNYI